jgi:hypothetical protein
MVQSANDNLSTSSASRLVREHPDEVAKLAEPGSLVGVATRVLKLSAQDRDYLQAIPDPLKEAMRAAIVDAVGREQTVQFAYIPAYDFELRFSDYGNALTIVVRGPYAPASPAEKAEYTSYSASAQARRRPTRTKAKRKAKPSRRRTTRSRRAR